MSDPATLSRFGERKRPGGRLVLRDEHPPELAQLRQDLCDLGVREVLQDLAKADVTRRQGVGDHVEMVKADSVAAKFLPVAINQIRNNVDTDIGMTKGSKTPPDPEVAATEVDESEFGEAFSPPDFSYRRDIRVDDMVRSRATSGSKSSPVPQWRP